MLRSLSNCQVYEYVGIRSCPSKHNVISMMSSIFTPWPYQTYSDHAPQHASHTPSALCSRESSILWDLRYPWFLPHQKTTSSTSSDANAAQIQRIHWGAAESRSQPPKRNTLLVIDLTNHLRLSPAVSPHPTEETTRTMSAHSPTGRKSKSPNAF